MIFDPEALARQVAGWRAAGLPEHEIASRPLEMKLERIRQAQQWLLAQQRVCDRGRNTAEQDTIAAIDHTVAAYDRVLKELPALIRRAQVHVV